MLKRRKIIKKLFDDNSIIKWDTKLYINNNEDRVRFWYPYGWIKLLYELLDLAVFCALWGEDFREKTFEIWEYEERTTITFKWWVGSHAWCMNVDYISERYVSYDEETWLNKNEIFSGFYYIDTFSLVENLLDLLDRSYKAFEKCKKEISWKNRKDYVIKNWDDVKQDLAWEEFCNWYKELNEIEIEMNDENLKKAKELMTFKEWYFDDITVEEVAEKKCYIIKQLRFWYKNDERYKDFPKWVNKIEPVVDLHANDEWKYPHIWPNFTLIWDWNGVDIEI